MRMDSIEIKILIEEGKGPLRRIDPLVKGGNDVDLYGYISAEKNAFSVIRYHEMLQD